MGENFRAKFVVVSGGVALILSSRRDAPRVDRRFSAGEINTTLRVP